jgi:hypothetical protein
MRGEAGLGSDGSRDAPVITRRAYIRRSRLVRKPRRYRNIGLKRKWYLDPEYLAVKAFWNFVAGEPCCVCVARGMVQQSRTEIAHVGLRGLRQKCSHWEVLPICTIHHARGFPTSHHSLGKRFWSFHGLDRVESMSVLRERYFGLTAIGSARQGRGFDREGL